MEVLRRKGERDKVRDGGGGGGGWLKESKEGKGLQGPLLSRVRSGLSKDYRTLPLVWKD